MRIAPLAPALLLIALAVLPSAPARAQTGAALLLTPWPRLEAGEEAVSARSQVRGSAMFFSEGEVDPTGHTISIDRYDVAGRFQLMPGHDREPAIGFEFNYMNIDTDAPGLPEKLVDQAIAVGGTLAPIGENGVLKMVVGGGYAGDNPFSDDGWYAMADLIFQTRLSPQSTLALVLSFDQHRALFPDVPIPAIMWTYVAHEDLWYSLGLPASSIHWAFAEGWSLDARFVVPLSGDITLTWEFIDGWQAFVGAHSRFDVFFVDNAGSRDRLFFSQKTVEAGFRIALSEQVNLEAAVGYGFDQEFSNGFDARDTRNEREVSSEAFGRLALAMQF